MNSTLSWVAYIPCFLSFNLRGPFIQGPGGEEDIYARRTFVTRKSGYQRKPFINTIPFCKSKKPSRLMPPKHSVLATLPEKFLVRALLDDTSILEYQQSVQARNGR